jgi:hypothetical protein
MFGFVDLNMFCVTVCASGRCCMMRQRCHHRWNGRRFVGTFKIIIITITITITTTITIITIISIITTTTRLSTPSATLAPTSAYSLASAQSPPPALPASAQPATILKLSWECVLHLLIVACTLTSTSCHVSSIFLRRLGAGARYCNSLYMLSQCPSSRITLSCQPKKKSILQPRSPPKTNSQHSAQPSNRYSHLQAAAVYKRGSASVVAAHQRHAER